MIVGIGTDLVRIDRFSRLIARYGDRIAYKILNKSEQKLYMQSNDKAAYLARRFAAKEAAVKALGTGFRFGIAKRDIAVTHDENGKPRLCFGGKSEFYYQALGVSESWISISDDTDYAFCTVILEK